MTDEVKCPVCGKVGISNYHTNDVICPQCGSYLSIFRIIDHIPDSKPKRNVWMPIAIVAILATTALAIVLPLRIKDESQKVEIQKNEIALLHDSINNYEEKLANARVIDSQEKVANEFLYIVKKGDSFWSISKRFYNTGTRFEEIANTNGLNVNDKLNVGDTLIIKQ